MRKVVSTTVHKRNIIAAVTDETVISRNTGIDTEHTNIKHIIDIAIIKYQLWIGIAGWFFRYNTLVRIFDISIGKHIILAAATEINAGPCPG